MKKLTPPPSSVTVLPLLHSLGRNGKTLPPYPYHLTIKGDSIIPLLKKHNIFTLTSVHILILFSWKSYLHWTRLKSGMERKQNHERMVQFHRKALLYHCSFFCRYNSDNNKNFAYINYLQQYPWSLIGMKDIRFGKNDIIPCLQSSLRSNMYYLCCNQRPATWDRMASTYKEVDFTIDSTLLPTMCPLVGLLIILSNHLLS